MILFVYGSLKRGCSNVEQMGDSKFLEKAITPSNYKLYDYGGYPALVQVEEGEGLAIKGELWEVSEETLARLDKFEGVDQGLYFRDKLKIKGREDKLIESYYYNRDLEGLPDCGEEWIKGYPYWDSTST